MSSEHFNYADGVTMTIITRPSPFEEIDPELENEEMDFGNRLVSFHLGIASNEPKNIISEIDRIMYSTEFGPGDHFSIEERYRRDEYGASGVFYDIVLAVGSGIISGVALHIITTYRDLANRSSNKREINLTQAANEAISTVSSNTGIPEKFIEVKEMQRKKDICTYLLSDKLTSRVYFVAYAFSIGVTEYRLCGRTTVLDDINNRSLLLKLLTEADTDKSNV